MKELRKYDMDKFGESAEGKYIAYEFNDTHDRITRHKKDFLNYSDQAKKEVLLEVKILENCVNKLTESVDKLSGKVDALHEASHKLELSQIKENGKMWAKIGALSAALGGAWYAIGYWIKGLR